ARPRPRTPHGHRGRRGGPLPARQPPGALPPEAGPRRSRRVPRARPRPAGRRHRHRPSPDRRGRPPRARASRLRHPEGPAVTLSAPHCGTALSGDAAVATLRGLGYPVTTVESLASDHTPFAVPVRPLRRTLAPGFRLDSTSIDLGDGAFTNAHTLRVDLGRVSVEAVSDPGGFHLRDLLRDGRALAAVSGSF